MAPEQPIADTAPMEGAPYVRSLLKELTAEVDKLVTASGDTASETVKLAERVKQLETANANLSAIVDALRADNDKLADAVKQEQSRADYATIKLKAIKEALADA